MQPGNAAPKQKQGRTRLGFQAWSSCRAFKKFLAHSSLQEHFMSSEMAWKGSAHMKKLAGNSCGFQEMQDSCHRLDFLCTVAESWHKLG